MRSAPKISPRSANETWHENILVLKTQHHEQIDLAHNTPNYVPKGLVIWIIILKFLTVVAFAITNKQKQNYKAILHFFSQLNCLTYFIWFTISYIKTKAYSDFNKIFACLLNNIESYKMDKARMKHSKKESMHSHVKK